MSEFDLHSTDDGQVWAQEFMRLFADRRDEIDTDLMGTWFANAIETGKDLLTVKELTDRAIGSTIIRRIIHDAGGRDDGGREFSTAITKLEEAQMWFTRGLAKVQGKFNPADLERDWEKSDG